MCRKYSNCQPLLSGLGPCWSGARTTCAVVVLFLLSLVAAVPVDAQVLVHTEILDGNISDVAMSGDTAVISSGTVEIYSRTDGRLEFSQELRRNGAAVQGRVAIDGSFIAVRSGLSVFVFEKVGSDWIYSQELTIPRSVLGLHPISGYTPLAITMTGDEIATGTGFRNQFHGRTTLSIFKRNGVLDDGLAKWELDEHLVPIPGSYFVSLSLENDFLLVATYNWNQVFLYERSVSGWAVRETFPFRYYPTLSASVLLNSGKAYYFDPHLGKVLVYSISSNPATLVQEVQTPFADPYGASDIAKSGDRLFLTRIGRYQTGNGTLGYEVRNDSLVNAIRLRQPSDDTARCCVGVEYEDGLLVAYAERYLFHYDTTREPFYPELIFPEDGATGVNREKTTLRWSAVENATSYRVQVWRPDAPYSVRVNEVVTDSFYTLSLPVYDELYSWWVKAETTSGNSEWSEQFSFHSDSESIDNPIWDERYDQLGPDSTVRVIASTKSGLVVGGDFQYVGAKRLPFVARWTGFNWAEVDGGLNGPPRLVASDIGSDNHYFLGDFDQAGPIQVNGFARLGQSLTWDDPLPIPVQGKPVALSFDSERNPSLYLATSEEGGGSHLYQYLEVNFTSELTEHKAWSFSDSITSVVAYNSEVLIGFDHPADGAGTPDQCQYYGCAALIRQGHVSALDPSFPSDSLDGIQHVQIGFGYQPDYIIAGDFSIDAGEKVIRYLARFDGTDWKTVGNPLSGPVRFLGRECDRACQLHLWVSRQLIYVGLSSEPYIALWNNAALHVPSGGTNGPVFAARANYFGGSFSQAGDVASNNLAFLWDALPVGVEENDENTDIVDPGPQSVTIKTVFPNPAYAGFKLRYAVDQAGAVQVRLIDVLGRLIEQVESTALPGIHEVAFRVTDLAAGPYLVVVRTNSSIDSRTLVVID